VEDKEKAHTHAIEIWDYLSEHGSKGMEFHIRAYVTCAEVFQVLGKQELARLVVETGSFELNERARKISNPEWRTFLPGECARTPQDNRTGTLN
jgi:hypothetical protein